MRRAASAPQSLDVFGRRFLGRRVHWKGLVLTSRSPKAIGLYFQAIKANALVFVSGQLPMDFASGQLVVCAPRTPTEMVLENLKAILAAAGSSLAKTVKTPLHLKEMNNFAKVNEVYGRFPLRSTAEVARLPKDVPWKSDLNAHG